MGYTVRINISTERLQIDRSSQVVGVELNWWRIINNTTDILCEKRIY